MAVASEILSGEALAALRDVGQVDVVAAVHALNREAQVERVLDVIESGIAKHAASRRAAVLVADAGSQDGTAAAARAWCTAERGTPRRPIEAAPPIRHGRAVHALLACTRELGARAIALFDADMVGLNPDAVAALIEPVGEGQAEYGSPAYSRSPSEGTLTTNLLAPLTRALYGRRIQQVTGGCAALAGPFAERAVEEGIGEDAAHAYGIEIDLTTTALAQGVSVVETHLGRRLVEPTVPQPDLATTIVRTVGPVFDLMERYREAWEPVRGSAALPARGEAPSVLSGAERPSIERMIHAFDLGMKDLLPVWEQVMPEGTLGRLYPLTLREPDDFQFRADLWARVVFDFAVAHHERRLPRDHLLRALTPLYLGRVAAFLREAWAATPARLADILDRIGRAFEAEKEDLAARWR